jgi:hypothetical protein
LAGRSPVDRAKQGRKRSLATEARGIPLAGVPALANKGTPAPVQATNRWPVERTFAWGNQFGKLRWCTERTGSVVEFWICLAHAIITLGRLICQAWTCYRWATRPGRRP